MTEKDLEIIKKRCEATTKGNWYAIIEGRDQTSGSSFILRGVDHVTDFRNPNRAEDMYLVRPL